MEMDSEVLTALRGRVVAHYEQAVSGTKLVSSEVRRDPEEPPDEALEAVWAASILNPNEAFCRISTEHSAT